MERIDLAKVIFQFGYLLARIEPREDNQYAVILDTPQCVTIIEKCPGVIVVKVERTRMWGWELEYGGQHGGSHIRYFPEQGIRAMLAEWAWLDEDAIQNWKW